MGQMGSFCSCRLRHSMVATFRVSRRLSSDLPKGASNLSASAAIMLPMMPVSGAKTPLWAQFSSSAMADSSKRQR